MATLLTLLLFIVIFGLVIFLHELGHYLVARREGMQVREFAFGFPPRLWSVRRGNTRFSLNAVPLGGYVSILGEDEDSEAPASFSEKSPWARLRVVVAGVTMNLLLAWVLMTAFFWLAPFGPELDAVAVASVQEGTAAEAAGIRLNDFVVAGQAEDGEVRFRTDRQLGEFTRSHAGQSVTLTILRNGTEQAVDLTLGEAGQAPLGVTVIDVSEIPDVPWYMAPFFALVEMWNIVVLTFGFFGQLILGLFTGESQVPVQAVSGPVGIFALLKQVQILGFPAVVHFAGLISLAVAIFNILPLPALDGGRAALLLAEGISGKRVLKPHTEAWLHAAGFFLLIALILIVTYFDIQKLG